MAGFGQRAIATWMRVAEPLLGRAQQAATARALRAARIARFPEWYLAVSYLAALLAGLAAFVVTYAFFAATSAALRWGAAGAVGVSLFLVVRLGFLAYPRVVASGRARRIDEQIPSVVTLCYALARGGMTPLDIFRTAQRERSAYGEAAVECGVIVRNVEWFGMDLVSALKETAATTPSVELRGFLDGLVTIMNSGAEPRDYFKNQAETRLKQAELSLEREMEQTSLLAEVYVSGLLVLPLLLLVVLSGLAPLAPGQDALMPFIVFAMIPLGTAVYVILLETMVPPDELSVPSGAKSPLADFGMHSVSSRMPLLPPPWRAGGDVANASGAAVEDKAIRALRWRLFFERIRASIAERIHGMRDEMLERPLRALVLSGPAALIVSSAVGYSIWLQGPSPTRLSWLLTGVLLLGMAIAMAPVAAFHEIRVRRAQRVERAMPATLRRLASFNERGISLLQSFQILGNASSGPLAEEMRAVGQDVTWNSSLHGALQRLRDRVRTLRMTKLTILLQRASAATGNLREVLDIAADDATRSEHLRDTKRQAMMSYVVVIYLVFAVFVYVLYVVANMFYGPEGLGSAAAAGASANIRPEDAKVLFGQAAVVQAVGCGLVAGRLGEGHMISGFKHAVLLGIIGFLVFHLGVI